MPQQKGNMKILIAEDQPKVVGMLEFYFERTRKDELVTAHSAQEIVDVAKDNPDIQVVVLDMDCLGGGSVLDAVRSLCPGCRFLLWSGGIVGDEDPKKFGVDALLSKAEPPIQLLMKLAELCPGETK